MKRSVRFAPFAFALLLGAHAHAGDLPNINKSLATPAVATPPPISTPLGTAVSFDPVLGVPTFFWADANAPIPSAGNLGTPGPSDLALAYLGQQATLYKLNRAARNAAVVRHVHDTGRGAVVVRVGQKVSGVDVFETEMKFVLRRSGQLVAIGGALHPLASPQIKGFSAAFSNPPTHAIAVALKDAFGVQLTTADLADQKVQKADYSYYQLLPTASVKKANVSFGTPARAKKVFYPLKDSLVPAYYLEVDVAVGKATSSDLYGYVIAAQTGEILMRRHLVSDAAFKYRVWADPTSPFTPTGGPQADFAPHPTGVPDGSFPPFVAPEFISMEGFNTNPNNQADPWLDAAATVTTGNNVDSYADLNAPDGFSGGDIRPTTTSAQTFDRTYDTLAPPAISQDQVMASATQLFYVTNWLHDYFYDSGFNESAGNAQQSNFGRGGVEGDRMNAEAQDGEGTDNANMTTPADGGSPRMQMYIWTSPGGGTSSLTVNPGNQSYTNQPSQFGPTTFNVTGNLIVAVDGAGADPNDGCEAIGAAVAGKIAVINRGNCTTESKVLRAQQAGAIGALVANNQGGPPPPMGDDPNTNGVTIASFGITQADGNALKNLIANGMPTATLARQSDPNRDGSIDNDIVAHEWGHYIHNRLVSCGTEQCGGEGEGWGDFSALLMKLRPGDNLQTGVFAMSTYATWALGDAGYFGIRRFPYTRDMAKNGLTFKHITNNTQLPAGPQNPINAPNFEVHNAGEVWCSMMFEAYTSLLISGGYPFAQAKRRMADYLVAGIIAAPPNPTFTEQRDGILAAALANDPADFALLAQGFAKRGAGTCAASPPKDSTNGQGVVEDFEISGQQELVDIKLDDSIVSCDGDGILDAQEVGQLHIQVRNIGGISLAGTTAKVSADNPDITFPNGDTVNVGDIAPYQTVEAAVQVALGSAISSIADVNFTIQLNNATACNNQTTDARPARVHYDDTPSSSTTETFDSDNAPWILSGAPGFEALAGEVWAREKQANGNFRFYGQDFPAHSDTALTSPSINVGGGDFTVTFDHAHDFEASPQNPGNPDTLWDGSLVEISQDGGVSWQDVSMFANPGYNGVIANIPDADNPLGDRPGYVKRNPSWPGTDKVTLAFGTQFANKAIQIRFRLGTDAAAGVPDFEGWYVDNIAVNGAANPPFHTVVSDGMDCTLAPTANAGTDIVMDEGTTVQLDGTGSKDPSGNALTYTWVQTSGPAATLSNPSSATPDLTAPQIDVDTPLTYQLTVSNGTQVASDTVNILVKNVASPGTGGSGGNSGGAAGSGGEGGNGGKTLDLAVSGCACRTAPSQSTNGLAAFSLLGLTALLARRRRSNRR
ncbi:MAG: M36 family metallopeptidase [Polyangiaceae bacterium]|nr:M36 family metallopeptidase [Polyangiaceae bacterium]